MNVVRKIYENLPAVIAIPDHLKNRRVELILLPLDEEEPVKPQTSKVANPSDKFIGAWQGEPLEEIEPSIPPTESLRPFGLCKGEFITPDDFDAPLPENILKDFEGR